MSTSTSSVRTRGPQRRPPVPILMYHEISPTSHASFHKWVVAPLVLARQMRWLAAAGYASVTLDELGANRVGGSPLPPRPVVITFDDGYRDCLQYAPEVLQRFGFTATFFVVAGLVGRTSRWLLAECGLELRLAEWAEIRRLADAGFEIGAHSTTHPRLAALPETEIGRELNESKRIVEDSLGRRVSHLAYPFGSTDGRVLRLAGDAGYRTACTVDIGVSRPGDDLLALRRVPVTGPDTLMDFVFRLHTGYAARPTIRRFLDGEWRSRARVVAQDVP